MSETETNEVVSTPAVDVPADAYEAIKGRLEQVTGRGSVTKRDVVRFAFVQGSRAIKGEPHSLSPETSAPVPASS